MSTDDRALLTAGSIAALLGVGAGVAEILAGTVTWAGNKNDPTTLGWVTIGLGVVIAAASVLATRTRRPGAQLASAAALVVCALLGRAGAAVACAALALHHRSHRAAADALVLAAVPFAAATAWSVVTPLTAVLMLAIGLPYVLGHPHTISSAGGTS